MAPRRPRVSQTAGGEETSVQEGGKAVVNITERKRKVSAVEPAAFVNEQKECVYCHAINNCTFRYINNCSADQPRYECLSCGKYFTHGYHGRVAGRRYKKRGEEPEELRGFKKVCPNLECGAENNAGFLYYNNHSTKGTTQPRYACNSCHTEFQLFPANRRRKTSTSATAPSNSKASTKRRKTTASACQLLEEASTSAQTDQPVSATMVFDEDDHSGYIATLDLHMFKSVEGELPSTSGRDFDHSQFDGSSCAQTENWAEDDFCDYSAEDLDASCLASSSDASNASIVDIGSPFLSADSDQSERWVGDDDCSPGSMHMMNSEEDVPTASGSGMSEDEAQGDQFVSGSSTVDSTAATMGEGEYSSSTDALTLDGNDVNEYEKEFSATEELVSYYLDPEPTFAQLQVLSGHMELEQQAFADVDSMESELQMEEDGSLKELLEQALDIARQSSWLDLMGTGGLLDDEDAACHEVVDDCWGQELPLGLFT